jgi:hypothetical protein
VILEQKLKSRRKELRAAFSHLIMHKMTLAIVQGTFIALRG